MHARGVFAVGIIGLFAVPACDLPGEERPPGEDDDDEGEDEGEDEDGEESSDDGVDAGPVAIGGVISAFAEMTPIGGADVCFADQAEMRCVVSGADGSYVLPEIAGGTPGGIIVRAEGYIPNATWGIATAEFARVDVGLLSAAAADVFEGAMGTPFDHGRSHIAVGVNDGIDPIAGASWTLAPPSGLQAYVGDDGLPSTSLTSTRANGIGGWINVEGTEVQLAITHPAATSCTASAGAIPGPEPHIAVLPLMPGHFNGVIGGFTCM